MKDYDKKAFLQKIYLSKFTYTHLADKIIDMAIILSLKINNLLF